MSAKQPLSSASRADTRKGQPRYRPRARPEGCREQAAFWLLRGLILMLLLASPASTSFISPEPSNPSTPLKPVGEVAVVTAPGFDTCVAPPANLLKTWWAKSPYRWLNVYIGGASMFPTCGGKNLTPEWVRAVYEQGWSLLPTWVGLQAPCAVQHAVMSSEVASSYTQGQAEADAAIRAARSLGFSNTAPLYFDMEHFNPTRKSGSRDTACIQAVNAFLNGWSDELTARNHLAGVYASASNYLVLGNSPLAAPAVAWIAGGGSWAQRYNRSCSVYGNRYLSDHKWGVHQRIYQYTGGHDETYVHQTWNIDSDCADAPLVGHLTAMSVDVSFQHP